tara:strand:+ start:234 stop:620 length:387 start_codon:yes stop_codon:yes gene_type:complete
MMKQMPNTLRPLRSITAFEKAITESNEKVVLIFKHSNSCDLSAMALDEVTQHVEQASSLTIYYLITVQSERKVSNEVSERLCIPHATPQIILVRNGKALWSASHLQITRETLREAEATHTQTATVPNT